MSQPRLLIIGAGGLLGSDLTKVLSPGWDVHPMTHSDVDITDVKAVDKIIEQIQPDWTIHAAALADVDFCELNPDQAYRVNVEGTRLVAEACKRSGAGMVFFSTDYVFDGKSDKPYIEESLPSPINVYGRTKLEAERLIHKCLDRFIILRVAWIYGLTGRDFIKAVLRQALTPKYESSMALRVVDDQIGNPTWSNEIANQLNVLLDKNESGLFHCTSAGQTTRYDFTRLLLDVLSIDVDVQPCTSEQFGRPAPRPRNSVLENGRLKRLGLDHMRDYRVALKEYLETYGQSLQREMSH